MLIDVYVNVNQGKRMVQTTKPPGGGFRSQQPQAARLDQARAAKARAVISSTVPVPLMARYCGAVASPVAAHCE